MVNSGKRFGDSTTLGRIRIVQEGQAKTSYRIGVAGTVLWRCNAGERDEG